MLVTGNRNEIQSSIGNGHSDVLPRSRLPQERGDSSSEPELLVIVDRVRAAIDCEAVGIRLIDADGNAPYEAHRGFPEGFCRQCNALSVEFDRCVCVEVMARVLEVLPAAVTDYGSVVFGTAAELHRLQKNLASGPLHSACPTSGFESVALTPIRGEGLSLGLLHCADNRPHRFTPAKIERLETIARDLGRCLFLDSIWPPEPWLPDSEAAGSGTVCPGCGRHIGPDGSWLPVPPTQSRLTFWTIHPARRAFCPDCQGALQPK